MYGWSFEMGEDSFTCDWRMNVQEQLGASEVGRCRVGVDLDWAVRLGSACPGAKMTETFRVYLRMRMRMRMRMVCRRTGWDADEL